MKTTLHIITAFVCLACVLHASPDIELAGVKYHLASVDVNKDGAVTNEFVPVGETIDAWTTLVAVRQWPNVAKLGEAASAWLKMIHPLLTRNVQAFRPNGAKNPNDLVFEAWLSAPDRSYIEINLHRFVVEPGTAGVKAYQFAQKVVVKDGRGDPTSFIKNRDAIFSGLGALQVSVVTKRD